MSSSYQTSAFYHTYGVYYSVLLSFCSCTAYSGTACSSVFGAANITNVGGFFSDIATTDSVIELAVTGFRDNGFSEACQNYIRIIQCLTYTPCSGTAWCGSMSPDDLTAALTTACTVGGKQATLTPNYYQGSSSTGTVGSAMLACQDVNLSK